MRRKLYKLFGVNMILVEKKTLTLVEADRPDFESEGLVRHAVVRGQKVHDWQLGEPRRSEFENCFRVGRRHLQCNEICSEAFQ